MNTIDQASIYYTVNRHRISPEFIRSRNRTDGVHCQESAGTEALLSVIKVASLTGATYYSGSNPMDQLCVQIFPKLIIMCASSLFSHPLMIQYIYTSILYNRYGQMLYRYVSEAPYMAIIHD